MASAASLRFRALYPLLRYSNQFERSYLDVSSLLALIAFAGIEFAFVDMDMEHSLMSRTCSYSKGIVAVESHAHNHQQGDTPQAPLEKVALLKRPSLLFKTWQKNPYARQNH